MAAPIVRAWTACVSLALLMAAAPAGADPGVEAITKPSEDVTLSFVRPGRVAKVLVKEGDDVKPGQVLVQQDDKAERMALEQLHAQANSQTKVKAAEADLAQKKVELKKIEQAAKTSAATELEVEKAALDVLIANLSLELARFQQQQDQLRYEETRIQAERMQIASPIAGRVEKISVKVGESIDALKDVIRVVNVSPFWAEVPVPLEQAKGLSCGQSAVVQFAGQDAPSQAGKIIHKAAVADAASDTLMVRLEVPNPSLRPAGEHVKVLFSATSGGGSPAQPESPTTKPTATIKE